MRLISILLFLFFPILLNAQGYWEKIDSPTDKLLRNLCFLDSLTGWIAGDSCTLFRTTDGGDTWENQYQNDGYDIWDITFLDENYGWAVASPQDGLLDTNSLMLKTTNGGIDWIEEWYPEKDIFLYTVFYQDTLNGWMGGASGNILYTSNGGERWHKAIIDSGQFSYSDVYDLKFYNDTFAVASGGRIDASGLFWVSRDGGMNWESRLIWIEPIVEFHFIDDLNILGVARDIDGAYGSGTSRSTDGGETWEYKNFEYFGPASSMYFRTDYEIWVTLSISEQFLVSRDTGKTWDVLPSPEGTSIYKLQFTDSLHGIGVGQYGELVRFIPDTTTDVGDYSSGINNFKLHQNYPNPFNPSTSIVYDVGISGNTSLKVYDLLGNEVAVLVNEFKQAGTYSAEFNTTNLPDLASGVYLCRMKSGEFNAVRKLILLK